VPAVEKNNGNKLLQFISICKKDIKGFGTHSSCIITVEITPSEIDASIVQPTH
jgi:hypothetical protein